MTVVRFDLNNKTNYNLMIELYMAHNISGYNNPVIFIGNEVIIGTQQITSTLEALLENKTGWMCPCVNCTIPPYPEGNDTGGGTEEDDNGQVDEMGSVGEPPLLLVAGIAFADSLNPCAITVLLLLLVAVGAATSGKWKLGLAYIMGNFLAYLLLGLGLLTILQQVDLPVYTNKLIGVAAIVLAAYTLFSKVPVQSRPTIKRLIGGAISTPLAFLAGAVISAIELPCTGGPYFLALMLMRMYKISQAEMLAYLMFYNAIFVLPLVIVLLLYAGALAPKIPKKHIRGASALLMLAVGVAMLLI
ncbi:MAG: hypothetical protein QFX35_04840 [Candidatus Verstraetearchaeota archaeon]|nr:hypothetical protein [Candidatus Verstraetearchaeota archaeon]